MVGREDAHVSDCRKAEFGPLRIFAAGPEINILLTYTYECARAVVVTRGLSRRRTGAATIGGGVHVNMLFWPLVLLALVLTALFLVGPPTGGLTAADDTELRMVYLTVLAAGVTIAAAGRLLLRGGPRTVRYAVIWLGVFSGIFTAFNLRDQLPIIMDRLRVGLTPSIAMTRTQGEAELRRGWDGHYRAETEINGVEVRMMIDTGASMVLLPYEQAAEFGIDLQTLRFSIPVTTANGDSAVAPIRLSSIKVGQIAVFDVHAAVAKPGKLKMGLLGMTFLDKLSETSFRGERLILRN